MRWTEISFLEEAHYTMHYSGHPINHVYSEVDHQNHPWRFQQLSREIARIQKLRRNYPPNSATGHGYGKYLFCAEKDSQTNIVPFRPHVN